MTISTNVLPLDGPAILANARAAAPVLREEARVSEQRRELTPRAVETLRSTGVFRMPMPRAWGGPEVDICTQVEILEELSAADGAAGWCAMVGSDAGFYTAAIDDVTGRKLYPSLDGITAGWIVPAGKLHQVEGLPADGPLAVRQRLHPRRRDHWRRGGLSRRRASADGGEATRDPRRHAAGR